MICRIWHGWTTPENAEAYEGVVRGGVIPGIEARRIPGFRHIDLMRRDLDGEVEFLTARWFDDLDSIKAFVPGRTVASWAPNSGIAKAVTSVRHASAGRSGRAHTVTNRTATSAGDEATPTAEVEVAAELAVDELGDDDGEEGVVVAGVPADLSELVTLFGGVFGAGSAAPDGPTVVTSHPIATTAASSVARRRGECSGQRTSGARASHASPVVAVRLLVLGIEPAPFRPVHLEHRLAVGVAGQVRLMHPRRQGRAAVQHVAFQRPASCWQRLPRSILCQRPDRALLRDRVNWHRAWRRVSRRGVFDRGRVGSRVGDAQLTRLPPGPAGIGDDHGRRGSWRGPDGRPQPGLR